jgi:hypothetical protein
VNGTITCFGEEGYLGTLGLGYNLGFAVEPLPVAGGMAYKAISAGSGNVCGIDNDGHAHCWVSQMK